MNTIKGTLGIAALAAVATAMLTVAACGPTKNCGPTNCSNGCCSEDGVCQTGLSNAQCGLAGGLCIECSVTQLCQAGVCTEFGNQNGSDGGTNNAQKNCLKSCQGCCTDSGECLSGTDTGACGMGEACRACQDGSQCISGTCIDPSCGTCTDSAGACDPAGSTTNNSACGQGGAPCQVCSGSGASCQNGICVGSCDTGCVDAFGKCKGGNTAGACGANGSTCTACPTGEICVGGACQEMPTDAGSCKSFGAECIINAECCSGSCDGTGHCAEADAGSCKGTEAACSSNSECCSLNCASGFCAPVTTDAGCTKKSDGASCMFASECCSNQCTNGFCGAPPTCDSSNCFPGCCLDGVCQSGLSNSACGDFGAACQACGSGTSCQPDSFGGGECLTVPPDAGTTQCKALSVTCGTSAECCSALCSGGVCAANSSGAPIGSNCGGLTNVCAGTGSTGEPVAATPSASCDPCVATVCTADDFCCNDHWDGTCANEAASLCSGRCGP